MVSLEAHNFIKSPLYAAIKDENHHGFRLTFRQMHADMRNIVLYFCKATSIPKLSDSGFADVALSGEDLTVCRFSFPSCGARY